MLTKYSVLTTLLIVTASLVGISSSIYQPANVKTQPQQPSQSSQPLLGSPQQKLLVGRSNEEPGARAR